MEDPPLSLAPSLTVVSREIVLSSEPLNPSPEMLLVEPPSELPTGLLVELFLEEVERPLAKPSPRNFSCETSTSPGAFKDDNLESALEGWVCKSISPVVLSGV